MRSVLVQGTILIIGPEDGITGDLMTIITVGIEMGREGRKNYVTWTEMMIGKMK